MTKYTNPKYRHFFISGDDSDPFPVHETSGTMPYCIGEVVTTKQGERFEVTKHTWVEGVGHRYGVDRVAEAVHETYGPFGETAQLCEDDKCYLYPSQPCHTPLRVSREFYDAFRKEFTFKPENTGHVPTAEGRGLASEIRRCP